MCVIAHLGDAVFQGLLISSIETFPSAYFADAARRDKSARAPKQRKQEGESFGLLFGQRMIKRNTESVILNATLAIPMQTVERKQDMVSFGVRYFDRIREVTESFPYLEFLGTFHSHPWPKDEYDSRYAAQYSEPDEENAILLAMEYGEELLEIILGITVLSRHSYRDARIAEHTIDSYCGRFKYSLAAYTTYGAVCDGEDEAGDEDNEELMGLVPVDRLFCPLAAHGGEIFSATDIEE